MPEQPNTELLIVKTIQGLMTCVANELDKLGFNREQHKLVCKAKVEIGDLIERVDLFEKTTLFELQKAFE